MSLQHQAEGLLTRGVFELVRSMSWSRSLAVGAALGGAIGALGVRRRVAMDNLALAFPERTPAERAEILHAHYREVGRIAIEYAKMAQLTARSQGEVFGEPRGLDAVLALKGRGALFLSAHFGNFELAAAHMSHYNPIDFLVKPQSNAQVDELVVRMRREAGVGVLSTAGGVKSVFRSLRAGRWIAIVADQDARRHGTFVPFFGRLASTPVGPARMALQLGVPIVFCLVHREADGRHVIEFDPPREVSGEPTDENVRALTAWHTARLEAEIRRRPDHWFWLHRRFKTAPPPELSTGA